MSGKYFSIGFDAGYGIAQENISELDLDNQDKFISDMSEHESDVYRQFSPFEFLAQEMNEWESRWNQDGLLWGAYERGVLAGIEQAIKDNTE